MRLPAVAIAAAFACGIVLGLHPACAKCFLPYPSVSFFIFTGALVLTELFFVKNLACFPGKRHLHP